MPISTPVSPGPTMATVAITSTMNGNAIMMSVSRESTVSTQPPMWPATAPMTMPMGSGM